MAETLRFVPSLAAGPTTADVADGSGARRAVSSVNGQVLTVTYAANTAKSRADRESVEGGAAVGGINAGTIRTVTLPDVTVPIGFAYFLLEGDFEIQAATSDNASLFRFVGRFKGTPTAPAIFVSHRQTVVAADGGQNPTSSRVVAYRIQSREAAAVFRTFEYFIAGE